MVATMKFVSNDMHLIAVWVDLLIWVDIFCMLKTVNFLEIN